MIKNIIITFLFILTFTLDLQELNTLITDIQESPIVNMLLVYDSVKMGVAIQPLLQQIQKTKQGYFKINSIDCASLEQNIAESFTFCKSSSRQYLPMLTYTDPVLNAIDPETGEKREAKQLPYQGTLDEKKLFDFALPLMKTYSYNLKSPEDLNKFNKDNAQINRIIYFTDKQTINPYYKALTANFRYTIAFGHVFKNSSLIELFKIQKYPALLLNGKQSLNIKSNLAQQINYLRQFQASQPANIIIPQPKKPAQNLITLEDVDQKVYKNSKYIFVHVFEQNKPHPQWKNVQVKFQKAFQYYQGGKQLMKTFGIKSLPSIVFFPKSLVKKEALKATFHEKINFQTIYDQVSELVQDYSLTISNDLQMQKITGLSLKQKKFVAILFHREQVSLSYRILSNLEQYKQKVVFHRYRNPQPQVLQQFQVKKIPSIIFMFMDQNATDNSGSAKQRTPQQKQLMKLRIAAYPGKFQFNQMKLFFDTLVPQPKKQQQDTRKVREVFEVKKKVHFQKYCLEQSCYLLLLDNTPQKKTSTENIMSEVQTLTKKVLDNVVWIDGVCHSQFLSKLQVQQDQLPSLFYFNTKNKRYSKLIGRLNGQSINTFVTKIKNNKVVYKPSYDVQYINKNCEQQRLRLENIKNSSTAGGLSDEQKQILQQIKKQQLIKRKAAEQQAKKAQKSKKKKKKQKKKVQESSDSDL